jgi:GH43 family beta-xylosidase
MYILSGPSSNCPPLDASWKFEGRMEGLPRDQWAIDGTIITLNAKNYFVYSGWPLGVTHDETIQELFIAEMDSPTSCSHMPPARICTPQEPWEFSGRSGINEGPQWLESPDAEEAAESKWCGLVYSCAGSWTHEYKMNTLQYVGNDPLSPMSWKKSKVPLLKASEDDTPPYGPGHGNFVYVEGETEEPETWAVFHATDNKTGWNGRRARVMRVGWNDIGPYLGNGECGRHDTNAKKFLGVWNTGELFNIPLEI